MFSVLYDRDGIQVIHGDAREALRQLPEASVNLLLTDPPYGMRYRGFGDTWRAIRGDTPREAGPLLEAVLAAADPLLARPAHAYVFCHYASYPAFWGIVGARWPIKSAIVWWKACGGMGDTTSTWARDYELALHAHVGHRPPLHGKREGSVLREHPPRPAGRIHPTEKPVPLLRKLIEKSTLEGDTVLDPFAGSLSVALAARECGRRAIVIEADEAYCRAGIARLNAG